MINSLIEVPLSPLRDSELQLQSEVEVSNPNTNLPTRSEQEGTTEQQNVNFSDDTSGDTLKFNPITDSTFYNDYIPNTDLGNFLSRPVEINSFSWAQASGTIVQQTINPWFLFFNNPIIKKKIDNYSFISCNLHVKIVINASPFLFGKLIAAYMPLSGYKTDTINDKTTTSALIPFSQRPHISILPSCNKGGEMVLPFFYNKNWIDITNNLEPRDMGKIEYVLYSALQSANGAAGNSVQVTTYAWAEDVRLCGPTIKPALQSEVEGEKDEYGQGVVSAPASAIATAAGWLENVPVIGRFATATRMGASAISNIASLFGFTNVPVIDDVKPYKNLVFHSLASTQIGEPVEKLTLDPKNELSIDPAISGLDANDELNIESLVTRDSYLTQFTWTNVDSKDDLKFSTTVLPLMNDFNAAGDSSTCDSTPMSHLQFLFWHWRGDMIYTFKFIKSPYHRGRVRISWDPTGDIISTADNTTAVFNQIVDISETDEVSIRVPYMQALPWLRTRQSQPSRGGVYDWWYTSAFAFEHNPAYSNGTLTLRVLNELTAPVTSATLDVMVHVRAAENFEFANPTDFLDRRSIFPVQSEVESRSLAITAGTVSKSDPNRYLVNFGESLSSLRTLLRRSTLAYVQPQELVVTDAYTIFHAAQSRIPPSWGFDPLGINSATDIVGAGSSNFNFVNRIPYTWLEPCYVGRRGSMIWHYNTDVGPHNSHSVRLERLITPITSANLANRIPLNFTGSTDSEMRLFNTFANGLPRYGSGLGGVALTDQNSQAGLSTLLPMYNNYRFEISDPYNTVYGTSEDGTDTEMFDLVSTVRRYADIGADNSILNFKYCSIGTDFTFLFFLNVPTMHVYNDPATV